MAAINPSNHLNTIRLDSLISRVDEISNDVIEQPVWAKLVVSSFRNLIVEIKSLNDLCSELTTINDKNALSEILPEDFTEEKLHLEVEIDHLKASLGNHRTLRKTKRKIIGIGKDDNRFKDFGTSV